jgi:hypothetical protein
VREYGRIQIQGGEEHPVTVGMGGGGGGIGASRVEPVQLAAVAPQCALDIPIG